MKKLFVLVPFFAVLLILSNVSFAQEAAAATEVAPCTCCYCTAAAPMPFAYPVSNVRPFAARLAARPVRVFAFAPPAATPPVQVENPAVQMGDRNKVFQHSSVGGAPVINFLSLVRGVPRGYDPYAGYYGYSSPEPSLVPGAPVPTMSIPVGPSAPMDIPPTVMGDRNKVYQRASVGGAPVINLLSVVRGVPRGYDPYAGYYGYGYGYPLPAESAE